MIFERDHPGTAAYDDLAQLASAGADAVAISTPADTHVPLVLEAVSLGLPEALLLFGPVMSVYAELDDAWWPLGWFFIAMRHAGGVVSHLVGDLLLHGVPGLRFRVFGTTASYDVDAFDGQADELMAGGSPAASGAAWGVVPRERWGRLHVGPMTRPWPSERGDWTEFYTSFARAIRGRGALPVDPWDAVAGLEVLEAAQRSAAAGRVVALNPGGSTR